MKKILIPAFTFILIFTACDKNDPEPEPTPADTNAPVIVLNGKSKDTISLNSTYSDPGATAGDQQDGNISASIMVSGSVNADLVGDYAKKYNVKDAAGNNAAEVTRLVHVKNDAGFLAGNYAVVPNCGATSSSNYTTNITVSSSVNNQFTFGSLQYNYTGMPAVASLANQTLITVSSLSGGGYGFSATGQVTAPKNITLTSSINNGFGTYNCTSFLTKQ